MYRYNILLVLLAGFGPSVYGVHVPLINVYIQNFNNYTVMYLIYKQVCGYWLYMTIRLYCLQGVRFTVFSILQQYCWYLSKYYILVRIG